MTRSAEFLASHARALHADQVEIWPTSGHPAVFAAWKHAPGKPTLLIYGHHDVQPVDPNDQWVSQPFEASVRDGRLYARGSVDDKGQVFMHLKAVESLLAQSQRLPINISLIVEGEEEVGSDHLMRLFREHAHELQADCVCVSDTDMFGPGIPSITVAMRGLAYFELRVQTAAGDLHSGSFGGAVPNAANMLCKILASLQDATGKVAIEGFYNDVLPVSPQLRDEIAKLPFNAAVFREQSGGATEFGEQPFNTLERLWTRPSCDINGITSGFQGAGPKTVIPNAACAKVSFRLVANQAPQRVEALLRKHVERVCPEGVRFELAAYHSALPYRAPTEQKVYELARGALARAFGRPALYVGEGGSIPFVPEISNATGTPVLLLGFGLPDGNSHAPNEWISLECFSKGIESLVNLYQDLAHLDATRRR